MVVKGYAVIDENGKVPQSQIPTTTALEMIFRSVQVGYAGLTGSLILYSEQGGTDYTATLYPNTAMTANAVFYLPAAQPISTYLLSMTSAGVIQYDTTQYVATTGNQSIDGVKTFTSFPVTPSANPSTSYQVANKAYVDLLTSNPGAKAEVIAATTAVLPACTYAGSINFTLTGDANGVIAGQDGITLANTNRLLVKNQADQKQNGIYVVTDKGANDPGGSPFILTRATDYDSSGEVGAGTFCFVKSGSTQAGYQYVQTTASPTIDVSNLVFATLSSPTTQTLATVTTAGASTTNAITVGGVTNTKATYESGIKNLVNTDSPYTVLSTDKYIYCNCSSGAINVLLPAASATGRKLSIGKVDSSANLLTITADTTGTPDTINGDPTLIVTSRYSLADLHDRVANEWGII